MAKKSEKKATAKKATAKKTDTTESEAPKAKKGAVKKGQFEYGDIETSKDIEQAFSNLQDHVESQPIPEDHKHALTEMIKARKERLDPKPKDLFHNIQMIKSAIKEVNQYL